MRPLGVLTAATAALVALVPGTSTSPATAGTAAQALARATHRVDVATLPMGSPAKVDYLTGRLLHTSAGRQVTISVPRRVQNSLELLGRSARGGWVVAEFDRDAVLAVAPSGRTHTIAHFYEDYPGASQLYLSTNRREIAIQGVDEGDAAIFRVVDLDGRTLARRTWTSGGETVAFRGNTLWFSRWAVDFLHGPLLRWRIGHGVRRTPARAVELLDLEHHQLLREVATDPEYQAGLASSHKPRDVRWTVCETCRPAYWATAFSPDGRWLLGALGYHGVQVRSTDDGHVRSLLAVSRSVVGSRWEGNGHLLVEVVRGSGQQRVHALVRCSLGGACARVSKWQHHWMLSYPR